MPTVRSRVTLNNMQLFRVRKNLEPALVVAANRVDDEHISFPPSYGMSRPRRIRLLRMRTAIEIHLSVVRHVFKKSDHCYVSLDDLEDERTSGDHRAWKAETGWVIFYFVPDSLFYQRFCPRQQRGLLRLPIAPQDWFGQRADPHAGKI